MATVLMYKSLGASVGDFVLRTLRGITLTINLLVYNIAGYMYRVFYLVTRVRIFDLTDPNTVGEITKRIYVVLGVVMLFVLAINVLRLIADPDKLTADDDNSLKGIAKNTVISLVLIVMLPFFYDTLDRVELKIIDSNIIGNIIMMSGTNDDNAYSDITKNGKVQIKDAGFRVALSIFSAFYHPVYTDGEGNEVALSYLGCRENGSSLDGDVQAVCKTYVEQYDAAIDHDNLALFFLDSTLNQAVNDDNMQYYWLWALACGGIAAYLFLSFAFDVGARSVKLMALELVAPIPIVLRITKPTGGVFTRWWNEIKSTYLLVFIRVATVYFAIYTISFIRENGHFWNTIDKEYGTAVSLTRLIAKAIIYISILHFAKTAPKLLDNIAGGLAKGEWRIKKKLNGEDYEYARRGMGMVATMARNLGREGFNIFNKRNADGTYTKRTGRERWQQAGRAIRHLPRTVIYGGYRGWQNGGGNLSELRGGVRKASTETFDNVDRRDARRERLRESRKNSTGVGKVIRSIPGLRGVALRFDDLQDAIATEGGAQQYFGNRLNYTSVSDNATKAGKFRKKLNPLVNSDSIQKGVQAIKDRASAEKAGILDQYNKDKAALQKEHSRVSSMSDEELVQERKRNLYGESSSIRSSAAYKRGTEQVEELYKKRDEIISSNAARDYRKAREELRAEGETFRIGYDTNKGKMETEVGELKAQRATVAADTTLTDEKKAAMMATIDSKLSKLDTDLQALETKKDQFYAEQVTKLNSLDATDVGRKVADLEKQIHDISEASGISEAARLDQLLTDLMDRDAAAVAAELRESYTADFKKKAAELFEQQLADTKEIDAKSKKQIDDKILENLVSVKDDLRAYMVAQGGELKDEFTSLTELSQRRILDRVSKDLQDKWQEKDGSWKPEYLELSPESQQRIADRISTQFFDERGNAVPVNLTEEFNKICQIIREKDDNHDYDMGDLVAIRAFLDGIKEEEVRGGFRARFVDKMYDNLDKEDDKGGGK